MLTGINLGCYRDRDAGYDLPRLVREARRHAGPRSGCASRRSRSTTSSDELVAAMRETPTVAPHLHVPLQSGDDGVLRAMGRRYTVATYLRRLELADGLQPHDRRDRRLPGGGRARRSSDTLGVVERAGITKVHVFPYSPRPGTRTADDDPVPPRGEARA